MAVKVCESDRRFDLKKAAHGHKLSGLFCFGYIKGNTRIIILISTSVSVGRIYLGTVGT